MWSIVPYSSEFRDGIVPVVRSVFDEYGFTWESDGYCRDLYDVETAYLAPGGVFFCAVQDDGSNGMKVIGCAGLSFHDGHAELHRMYLRRDCRGQGIGRALLEHCMKAALNRGATAMRAWSDVKLTDAHRLYKRAGFQPSGERICDDPDKSREFGFWKEPL